MAGFCYIAIIHTNTFRFFDKLKEAIWMHTNIVFITNSIKRFI